MGMYLPSKSCAQSSEISPKFKDALIDFNNCFLKKFQYVGKENRDFSDESRLITGYFKIDTLNKICEISRIVNNILSKSENLSDIPNFNMFQVFEDIIINEIYDCLMEIGVTSEKETNTNLSYLKISKEKNVRQSPTFIKFWKINEKIINLYDMFGILNDYFKWST